MTWTFQLAFADCFPAIGMLTRCFGEVTCFSDENTHRKFNRNPVLQNTPVSLRIRQRVRSVVAILGNIFRTFIKGVTMRISSRIEIPRNFRQRNVFDSRKPCITLYSNAFCTAVDVLPMGIRYHFLLCYVGQKSETSRCDSHVLIGASKFPMYLCYIWRCPRGRRVVYNARNTRTKTAQNGRQENGRTPCRSIENKFKKGFYGIKEN